MDDKFWVLIGSCSLLQVYIGGRFVWIWYCYLSSGSILLKPILGIFSICFSAHHYRSLIQSATTSNDCWDTELSAPMQGRKVPECCRNRYSLLRMDIRDRSAEVCVFLWLLLISGPFKLKPSYISFTLPLSCSFAGGWMTFPSFKDRTFMTGIRF